MLVDGLLGITSATFHTPALFSDISALTAVSSASWLAHQWLGCTSQACKPYSCPALGPKSLETATETPWFFGRGLLSKRSWSDTPLFTAEGEQTGRGSVLHYRLRRGGAVRAEKEATIYRGTDVMLAQLPGKSAAGAGGEHVGSY